LPARHAGLLHQSCGFLSPRRRRRKNRYFDRLVFADSAGRRGTMEASSLAPPMHMAGSFAAFPLLDWRDKRAIAQALVAIARAGGRKIPTTPMAA
jgi:hypothetical protein